MNMPKPADKQQIVNARTTEVVKNPKAKGTSKASRKAPPKSNTAKTAKNPPSSKGSSPSKSRGWNVIFIISVVLASIIVLYCLVDLCTPIFYGEFYKNAEKSVKIPGLNEAFVPQGFAFSETLGSYLVCGYMSNSEQSRIYIVDGDGSYKEIRLKNQDGSNYTGHAGGISCNGNDVYISNNKKIYYLTIETLKKAQDLESVAFVGSFDVPCRSSFTFCNNEMLYVGEFYTDGYSTDPNHKLQSADGEHNAFLFGYKLDSKGTFGVSNIQMPDVVYSICDKVQGAAMTNDGKAVLSTSYGLANSNLKIYDCSKATRLDYKYNDGFVPLYILDSSCMEKTVTMPWGSEDIDVYNDQIVIGFEFAAKKFGGGLLPFAIENIMLYRLEQ
jgi:hypothetical protein